MLNKIIPSEKILPGKSISNLLDYNPSRLLDILIGNLNLKNDISLSFLLNVSPSVISKIRHGKLLVGASLLIRMHEISGFSINELRQFIGNRQYKYQQGELVLESRSARSSSASPLVNDIAQKSASDAAPDTSSSLPGDPCQVLGNDTLGAAAGGKQEQSFVSVALVSKWLMMTSPKLLSLFIKEFNL